LSEALNRLINEPAVRTDLAERAHNRALEFTTLRTASSCLALYAEMMKPDRISELVGAT
jgi:hypothetical protein